MQDVGLRRLLGGGELIDRGLRHVLIFHQRLGALQLQTRVDLGRFGLGKVGVLLIERCFVGVLFDAKQQVTGLDHLPFGEIPLLDKAGHPRDDIDFIDCDHAADEVTGFSDLVTGDGFHRNRRYRRSALRHGAAIRNGQGENGYRHPLAEEAGAAKYQGYLRPQVRFLALR